MKKTFFIITGIASLAAIPSLYVFLSTLFFIFPKVGRPKDFADGLFITLEILFALVPILFLLIGLLKNKNNTLSSLFMTVAILINIPVLLISLYIAAALIFGAGPQ